MPDEKNPYLDLPVEKKKATKRRAPAPANPYMALPVSQEKPTPVPEVPDYSRAINAVIPGAPGNVVQKSIQEMAKRKGTRYNPRVGRIGVGGAVSPNAQNVAYDPTERTINALPIDSRQKGLAMMGTGDLAQRAKGFMRFVGAGIGGGAESAAEQINTVAQPVADLTAKKLPNGLFMKPETVKVLDKLGNQGKLWKATLQNLDPTQVPAFVAQLTAKADANGDVGAVQAGKGMLDLFRKGLLEGDTQAGIDLLGMWHALLIGAAGEQGLSALKGAAAFRPFKGKVPTTGMPDISAPMPEDLGVAQASSLRKAMTDTTELPKTDWSALNEKDMFQRAVELANYIRKANPYSRPEPPTPEVPKTIPTKKGGFVEGGTIAGPMESATNPGAVDSMWRKATKQAIFDLGNDIKNTGTSKNQRKLRAQLTRYQKDLQQSLVNGAPHPNVVQEINNYLEGSGQKGTVSTARPTATPETPMQTPEAPGYKPPENPQPAGPYLEQQFRDLGFTEQQIKAARVVANPVLELGAKMQKPMVGLLVRAANQVDKTGKLAQEIVAPFYSKLERVAQEKLPGKGTAEQIRKTLEGAGVKPEEMQWTRMDDILEPGKTLTKQDVLDHIAENQVRLEEVMKGGSKEEVYQRAKRKAIDAGFSESEIQKAYGRLANQTVPNYGEYGALGDILRPAVDASRDRSHTKFSTYALPGGKNYRELLLTLPDQSRNTRKALADSFRTKYGEDFNAHLTPDEVAAYDAAYASDKKSFGANFTNSHWSEPNVLAHIRFDERTGPNGEKTLHVAEIQSDWHQKGRKGGYATETKKTHTVVAPESEGGPWLVKDGNGNTVNFGNTEAEAMRWADSHNRMTETAVPDAPFKKSWQDLALKRIMRYAAENGYDRVTWDTGITNAERYDLSKQVRSLEYDTTNHGLKAYTNNGDVIDRVVEPNDLPDVIGKEAADKLLNNPTEALVRGPGQGSGNKVHFLRGLDLKVGGEGMKGFYDKILPDAANKLFKKYGAKVEGGDLPGGPGGSSVQRNKFGTFNVLDEGMNIIHTANTEADAIAWAKEHARTKVPAHSLTITPEMKSALLNEGQPLFQGAKKTVKGTYNPAKRVIELVEGKADVSTVIHEVGHYFHDVLLEHPEWGDLIRKTYGDLSDVKGAEKFARHFEGYLRSGEAAVPELKSVFAAIAEWMKGIYNKWRYGSASPEVKAIFDEVYSDPSPATRQLVKEFEDLGTEPIENPLPDQPSATLEGAAPKGSSQVATAPAEGATPNVEASSPEPPAAPTMPTDDPTKVTQGVSHAEVDNLRKEMEWEPRTSTKKTDAQLAEDAKKLKGSEERIARRILEDKKDGETLSDEETVAVGMRLQELKKEMRAAKQADDAEGYRWRDELARDLATSIDLSGARQGRAFRARRFIFDGNEDAWSLNRRAESANYHQPLDPKQKSAIDQHIEDLLNANDVLVKERDKAVADLKKLLGAEKRTKGPASVERRRAEALRALKKLGVPVAETEKAPTILAQLDEAVPDLRTTQEQVARAMRSLVRSYADEGLTGWNDVMARLKRDLPGIDEENALFILSGEYKQAKLEADLAKKKINDFMRDVRHDADAKMKPFAGKVWSVAGDIINTSQRELQTTLDNSLALIQAKNVLVWKPGTWFKAVGNSLKAGVRLDPIAYTKKLIEEVKNDPLYARAVQAKLALSDVDGPYTKQEEFFAGQITNYIPGLANSKAMATVLGNKLRMDLFRKLAAAGPDTPEYLADIARQINIVTGKGTGKVAEALGGKASGFIAYAPRFTWSKWQHNLGVPIWAAKSKAGRVQAIKMYAQQLIGYIALTQAAQLFGFTVELDPRSTNFGTATSQDGKYSFDLWRSQAEPFRIMAQFVYGKISKKGKYTSPTDFGAFGYGDYLETKASPGLRSLTTAISGSTYDENTDERRTARASDFWRGYIPLSIKEMMQNQERPATMPFSFLGANIGKGVKRSPRVPFKAVPPGIRKMRGESVKHG